MHTMNITEITGGRTAVLTQNVASPVGVYSAWLPVQVITMDSATAIVCLDDGFHPAGTCHTARLTLDQFVLTTTKKD